MTRELPRYFPRGYFEKWFWICAVMNAGLVAFDFSMLWIDRDRPALLLVMAGATALQILTAARFVLNVARDSREWRLVDRPRLVDLYADLERMRDEHERAIAELDAELKRRGIE